MGAVRAFSRVGFYESAGAKECAHKQEIALICVHSNCCSKIQPKTRGPRVMHGRLFVYMQCANRLYYASSHCFAKIAKTR